MPEPSQKTGRFTYGDYLSWPEDKRREIIDGVPYSMSPAPSTRHQEISWELSRQIANFLTDKPCRGFTAPFDVRFQEKNEADEQSENVVQPDIVVICDLSKIDDRGCRGAPDFIAEIVSPSTAAQDQIRKLALYETHGVKEYWLVHPLYKLVTVHILGQDGKYGLPKSYDENATVEISVLPSLKIALSSVFVEETGQTEAEKASAS